MVVPMVGLGISIIAMMKSHVALPSMRRANAFLRWAHLNFVLSSVFFLTKYSNFILFSLILFYVYACLARIACVLYVFLVPVEVKKEASDLSGTEVTDGYEPLCGWWELSPVLLREQQVLLPAEPFLQRFCSHLSEFYSKVRHRKV